MKEIEYKLHNFLMSSHQLAVIPNFFYEGFECDMFVMNNNLYTTEYEIKKTVADYKRDFKKVNGHYDWHRKARTDWNKHDKIRAGERTNRFFFVVPFGLIASGKIVIPDYAGCITFEDADGWVLFKRVKQAGRRHNRQSSQNQVKHCLQNLNFRYYQATRKIGKAE